MNLPIPMTLRTRLFLSISALMTVAMLGLVLGLVSVVLLGRQQEQVLTRHFATIEVSQKLRQALGDQLVLMLSEARDPARLEEARQRFQSALDGGRKSSRDAEEQRLFANIDTAHRAFVAGILRPDVRSPELLEDGVVSRSLSNLRASLNELHEYSIGNIEKVKQGADRRASLTLGLLGLVGVAILVIGFITAHGIARRFGAPIEIMAKAADKIGQGDFDVTLPISTVAEMASLIRRFGLMAESLRQYKATNIEALDYGRKRLQAVLDSISDGLVIIDRHGRVEHANPVATQQLFSRIDPHGRDLGELLGNSALSEATLRVLHGNALEEEPEDLAIEVAGEPRLLAWSMTAVTHDDGRNMGAVMVVRDVTEQRNFERVRSEFVLRASHELRTPVTGMHMAFGLLQERLAFPEDSRESDLVTTVDEEMRRLVRLINDLLNFSRYQSGQQKLELHPCHLPDLLQEVHERFAERADSQGIQIDVETEGDLPNLNLDRLQIERVLDNLLGNALRHTASGGQIHLQARRQGRRVSIAVEDTGEGIAFSQLHRIFEPFVQVGRKKGGAGLGLALCKEIVQLHGGHIAVQSQQGKGSRFLILLPVA